jgi:hypothetical protein
MKDSLGQIALHIVGVVVQALQTTGAAGSSAVA